MKVDQLEIIFFKDRSIFEHDTLTEDYIGGF